MYCYRGVKYNKEDLKKQATKKSKESDVVTYRGITGKIAA